MDRCVEQELELHMAAKGFVRSDRLQSCGLCIANGKPRSHWVIGVGDWVRRMPRQWQPKRRNRYVHSDCLETLITEVFVDTGVMLELWVT